MIEHEKLIEHEKSVRGVSGNGGGCTAGVRAAVAEGAHEKAPATAGAQEGRNQRSTPTSHDAIEGTWPSSGWAWGTAASTSYLVYPVLSGRSTACPALMLANGFSPTRLAPSPQQRVQRGSLLAAKGP